jgi:hypothetical protein
MERWMLSRNKKGNKMTVDDASLELSTFGTKAMHIR